MEKLGGLSSISSALSKGKLMWCPPDVAGLQVPLSQTICHAGLGWWELASTFSISQNNGKDSSVVSLATLPTQGNEPQWPNLGAKIQKRRGLACL